MSVNMVASGYIRNQSDAEVYNSNEQETLRYLRKTLQKEASHLG